MYSEDVEVASACAPLRGYTMHVWHPSQQGGSYSSDCTVAAKTKTQSTDIMTCARNPTQQGTHSVIGEHDAFVTIVQSSPRRAGGGGGE